MAMITCAECNATVSSAAMSCPQCGAGKKVMVGRKSITAFGWAWRGFLGLFALLMIMTAWSGRNAGINNQTASNEQQPATKEQPDPQLDRAVVDFVSLKRSLRDPDSLKIESIRATGKGDTVCIRYRANNGFGGVNREAVVFLVDAGGSTSTKLWRAFCKRGEFVDLTQQVMSVVDAIGQ